MLSGCSLTGAGRQQGRQDSQHLQPSMHHVVCEGFCKLLLAFVYEVL